MALVDAADFEWLSQWRWCAIPAHIKHRENFYAARGEWLPESKKQRQVAMHRVLMSPPPGHVVDHINGVGLDNRRSNLRICTPRENAYNIRAAFGKSKYRGVGFYKAYKCWRAYIQADKKWHHLGYFETEIEAAQAYDRAAVDLFGAFAVLNCGPSGVDAPPIVNALGEVQVATRPRRIGHIDKDKVLHLRANGSSYREIATTVGCSPRHARRIVLRQERQVGEGGHLHE